jgi:purine-nucleoside phosphorylase
MGVCSEIAADYIRRCSKIESVDFGIILGSGWGSADRALGEKLVELHPSEVPGFSKNSVPGHQNLISVYKLSNDKTILAIGARSHLYEGKGVDAVVHPIQTISACGARTVILTNGAGGMREDLTPGEPVLISDHINLSGSSPLEGARFIDLTNLYSERLRTVARNVSPTLREGVYVQLRGPNYETPAEIRMLRSMGGDLVGMSTALEAIKARELGMEILGLSLVTNLASGLSPHPLSHKEVTDAGISAGPKISELLGKITQAL